MAETGEHNMRAFIFPGQGSQAVGMGKALAEASAVARAPVGAGTLERSAGNRARGGSDRSDMAVQAWAGTEGPRCDARGRLAALKA